MVTVYVLEGETGRRYVGITNDLARRLKEHGSGQTHSGRLIGPFRVIHLEEYTDHVAAREREKFLKSGEGREWLSAEFPRPGPACGG
jgi:putative endonuclease